MQFINDFFTKLVVRAQTKDEEGQTLVEYGLLVGLLSIAGAVAFALLVPEIEALVGDIGDQMPG
jgi:Flp pilus assembly pilin Flp